MEDNTRAIVELAWARLLGLDDDDLGRHGRERITRVDDLMVSYVRLWGSRVLIGPRWLLERAAEVADRDLTVGSTLLALTAGHGGRLVGETSLACTDDYVEHDGLDSVLVTDDLEAAADLERQCPPDDVTAVGLTTLPARFVTVDELDRVTAGAGYAEWQGLLAEVGVLTPPELRRGGRGTLAAAVATNDALDSGLVPLWRARRDSAASQALSTRLGYRTIGSQTTVLLV